MSSRLSCFQGWSPQGWCSSGLVLLRGWSPQGFSCSELLSSFLRAGRVQGCPPQDRFSAGLPPYWSCSGLLSSGLALFRTALSRLFLGAKGFAAQGWCCSGLLSSGLVSFKAALPRAGAVQGCSPQLLACSFGLQWQHLGSHLGQQMAAFEKPFGTANGCI